MNERDPDWREVLRERNRPLKSRITRVEKHQARTELAQKVLDNEWYRHHKYKKKTQETE